MKKCEQCLTADIDDKYKICQSCHNKNLAEKKSDGNAVEKELGAINNNLYYIRRALALIIKIQYGKEIVWNRAKKDFEEKSV